MNLMIRVRSWQGRLDDIQERRPWLAVPFAVLKKFGDDGAGRLAAVIAYYGVFSLFPLLLVAVTVLGYLMRNDPALRGRILDSAIAQFPVIGQQIRLDVHGLRGSGVVMLVGVAGALWSGLAVFSATQLAMDDIWDVPLEHRPPTWRGKVRALALVSILGVVLIAAGVLAGLATTGSAYRIGLMPISLVLNFIVVAAAFKLLTAVRVTWRMVFPGAALAALAWLVLQTVGGYLVHRQVRSASEIYGFFAVVIGLLWWIYLAAQVLLLSAEFNVVIARRLWPRRLFPPPSTKADRRVRIDQIIERVDRPEIGVSVRIEGSSENDSPAEGM